MVRGVFSSLEELSLEFPSAKTNSEEHQQVVGYQVLPFMSRFPRLPLVFQQDNANVYVSHS